MHLLIYGADYCSFTQSLWSQITNIPFLYMPYKYPMDKKHYWQGVKDSLSKKSDMTFPTLVLLDEKDKITQVYLKRNVLIDDFGKQYELSSLKIVPGGRDVPIVKDKNKLMQSFTSTKLFSYQPN